MEIKNKTNGKVITKSAKLCASVFSKTVGLMFSKKPKTLIFKFNKEKIVPLHMFFVFFPIDVLFLDKNKTIIEIKENFKPFSFYNPKNKAGYIIEFPKDTIKNKKIRIGNKLNF